MILIGGLEGSAASLPGARRRTRCCGRSSPRSSPGSPRSAPRCVAGVAIGVGRGASSGSTSSTSPASSTSCCSSSSWSRCGSSRGRAARPTSRRSRSPPGSRPSPSGSRPICWVRHLDRIVLLVLLGRRGRRCPLVITQPSRQLLYATIAAFAICALSLTVLTGWAGQLSLGQMAFAGIGALTAAALTRGLDDRLGRRRRPAPRTSSSTASRSCCRSSSARCSPRCSSVVIGAGALRVRGLLLAVTTFAFAIAAASWVYRLDVFSGGNASSVPLPPRRPVRARPAETSAPTTTSCSAVLVVVIAVLGRLRRRASGRVTLAVRDNADTRGQLHGAPGVGEAPGLRPRRLHRRARRRAARRRDRRASRSATRRSSSRPPSPSSPWSSSAAWARPPARSSVRSG